MSTAAPAAAASGAPFTATHTRARRSKGAAASAAADDHAAVASAASAAAKPTFLATHTKQPASKRKRASAAAAAASIDLTGAESDSAESDADDAAPVKRSAGRPKKKLTVAQLVKEAQARAAKEKRTAATIASAKKIKKQQQEAINKAKAGSQKHKKKAAESASDESSASEAESAASSESESESAAAAKKKQKKKVPKAAAVKDNVKRCRYCSRALEGRGISAAGAAAHLAACKKRTPAERESYNRAALQRSHAQKMKRAGAWGGDASDDESSSSSSDDDDDGKSRKRRKRSKSPPRRVRGGRMLSAEGLMKQVGYDLAGVSKKAKLPVYEVEAVRDRRFNTKTLSWEYLIKWCAFPEDENTWEPAATTHCRDLIHQYHIAEEEALTERIDDAVERAHRDPPEVAFHRDGLCTLVKKAVTLPLKDVQATESMISRLFNSTLRSITNRDLLDVLESRGFDNFKLRQRGRYDLALDPTTLPFLERAPWLPAVKAILGGKAKLQHVGCMMSLPSSETQPWHSDGPHRNKDCHLPAYMVNVFMPLIDMSRSLGGTQFQPGSHVHHDFHIRTTSITPMLKAGQSLLFDYRIRHRGLENRDTVARPLLYCTYSASDDIVDDANFAKGRYKPLPALIPELEESREERMKKRRSRGLEGSGGSDDADKGEQKDGSAAPAAAAAAAASSSSSPVADVAMQSDPDVGEQKESKRGRGRPRKSAAPAEAASSPAPSAAAASSSSAAAASSSSSSSAAAAMSDETEERGERKHGGGSRIAAQVAKAKPAAEEKSRTKSKRRGSASNSMDEEQGERKNAAANDQAAGSSAAQAMQLD